MTGVTAPPPAAAQPPQVYYGNAFEPRRDYGAKFEPAATVLHGAGQDPLGFAAYVAAVGPERVPAYMMTYLWLESKPSYISNHWGPSLARHLARYPADMGVQVGLSFDKESDDGKTTAERIVAGELDEHIVAFARAVNGLNRPIFVRVGYEFNGGWNDYEPATYIPAFRRITAVLREHSDRIAIVWTAHPEHELSYLMTYYPGDEWVDWWGIDLFEPKYLVRRVTRAFLREADRRGKPVMIGEATPAQVGADLGPASWQAWYLPFFELIRTEPGIKAFSYINRQWTMTPGLESWGDSRITSDALVLKKYHRSVAMPLYQHASSPTPFEVYVEVADRAVAAGDAMEEHEGLRVRRDERGETRVYLRFPLPPEIGVVEHADLYLGADVRVRTPAAPPAGGPEVEEAGGEIESQPEPSGKGDKRPPLPVAIDLVKSVDGDADLPSAKVIRRLHTDAVARKLSVPLGIDVTGAVREAREAGGSTLTLRLSLPEGESGELRLDGITGTHTLPPQLVIFAERREVEAP